MLVMTRHAARRLSTAFLYITDNRFHSSTKSSVEGNGGSATMKGEYVNVWLDDAQMTCFSLKVLDPPMRA